MDHDLEVVSDPAAVAARGASYVAALARAAVAAGSRFSFAVSGGQTPWAMFRALAAQDSALVAVTCPARGTGG